jgi:hypothetical protein
MHKLKLVDNYGGSRSKCKETCEDACWFIQRFQEVPMPARKQISASMRLISVQGGTVNPVRYVRRFESARHKLIER